MKPKTVTSGQVSTRVCFRGRAASLRSGQPLFPATRGHSESQKFESDPFVYCAGFARKARRLASEVK